MNSLISDWLPGAAVMANIHPLVVHFPIALLTTYWVMATGALLNGSAGLRQVANGLLYLGTLAAAATVITGLMAADSVEHDEAVHGLMEIHEYYAIAVLVFATALSIWNRWLSRRMARWGRALEYGGSLVLVALVTLTADHGGTMVYGHGVAVVVSPPDAPPSESPAPLAAPDAEDSVLEAVKPEPRATTGDPSAHRHPHSHTHHHHSHSHTH